MPVESVDVFVRSKEHSGKTLRELADEPFARGIYLRRITRNLVEIPILPETEILRGDILRIGGSKRHVDDGGRGARPRGPARRGDRPRVRRRRHRDRRSRRRAELRLARHPDQPVDLGRRAARGSRCSATCAPSTRPSATSRARRCGS